MQIFIQLSNEYSYKSLCWPNVTSLSPTSHTVKKPAIPFSKVNYFTNHCSQTLWIYTANCPASYNHQKHVHQQCTGERYQTYRIAQSCCHNEKRKIDRTISTYILTKTPRTFHTLPDLQATTALGLDLRPPRKFVTDIISKNRSGTQTNKLNSATQ